jgi:ribosomal protein S18 acetylase RimI-like enzyme
MAITKQQLEEFLPYEVIRIIEEYDPIYNYFKLLHQLKMRAVIGKIARFKSSEQYFGWKLSNEYGWPFQQDYGYIYNSDIDEEYREYEIDKEYMEYSDNLKIYHRVLGRKPRERVSKFEVVLKAFRIGHYIEIE